MKKFITLTILTMSLILVSCDSEPVPANTTPVCGNGILDRGEIYEVTEEGEFLNSEGTILDSEDNPLNCSSDIFGFSSGELELESNCKAISSMKCTGCPEEQFACAGQCHYINIEIDGEPVTRSCYMNQLIVE